MPNDRRNHVPGATYAFTVTLRDRRSDLLVTQIDHLRAAVQSVRSQHPFTIDAWVVLPDHMHCLWTLPPNDAGYPLRLKRIKGRFSQTQPRVETPRASPASRPLRVGFADGLRPALTQAPLGGSEKDGRGGETALDQTEKHRHDGRVGAGGFYF